MCICREGSEMHKGLSLSLSVWAGMGVAWA